MGADGISAADVVYSNRFIVKYTELKYKEQTMGASNKVCPNCGRKMKQQFIGLQHCRCGMSWKKGIGFFERTPDMVFALERQQIGKKVKQRPVIRKG